MEAVRKIVDAGLLARIIDLPWETKNMRVEIIVMPFGETAESTGLPTVSLKGRLKEYADPALVEKERQAWGNHTAQKYGIVRH